MFVLLLSQNLNPSLSRCKKKSLTSLSVPVPREPDTKFFPIVLLYLVRKKVLWWCGGRGFLLLLCSWEFVTGFVPSASRRLALSVPQPNRFRFLPSCWSFRRFGAARRHMQAVSHNLMTSWNNSLTLVHSLPPSPSAVPLLSPPPPVPLSAHKPFPFPCQPNQTTFRVPLSRVPSSSPVRRPVPYGRFVLTLSFSLSPVSSSSLALSCLPFSGSFF